MDGTSQAAVTPQGVRDGDPAVLAALVARRGPAVLAFCDAVCEPEVVSQAVAEAFARFRALVATVGDAGSSDPEAFLLGATRHAAASMARTPSDSRGVLRSFGRGTSAETYAAVPALLAARADSMLGGEDLERLSRLLERSAGCREVEASFRRAERGYKSPPSRPLGAERTRLAITAMQAAAPIAEQFAHAYPAPEPAAEVDAPNPDVDVDPTGEDPAVLSEPTPTVVVPVVNDAEADAPAPDAGALPPATFAPARDPEVPTDPEPDRTGVHQVLVPPGDPVLAELEAGVPVDSPPKVYRARRTMPRMSLPDGGGLRLPRRGSQTTDEAGDDASAVDHGPIFRLLLPALAIFIAVLVMLAIAGVFGGGDPAPAAIVTPAVATQLPPGAGSPAVTTGTSAARVSVPTTTPTTPAKPKRRHAPAKKKAATSASTAQAQATPPPATTPAPPPSAPAQQTKTTPASTPKSNGASPSAGKQSGSGAVPGSSSNSTDDEDDGYVPYDPNQQPSYP